MSADGRDEARGARDASSSRMALRVLADARLLLIALWLGGAVFFSFVVAPSAFRVLPTHELAGALVTETIAYVNLSGIVIGALLFASLLLSGGGRAARRARRLEGVSLLIVVVACSIGHSLSRHMADLRVAMGRPIDRVPLDDPARVAFDSLHTYSVALMCV
ncbi:MAG: DUF4149 domain-containing protein, partial [Pyrinomonadaceae bacterium]